MELRLAVRRFFCRNEVCAKVTFIERFQGLTAPWAQRSEAVRAAVVADYLHQYRPHRPEPGPIEPSS